MILERVDALATVHRRLYQADDVSRFDIGGFAFNLVTDVLGAVGRSDIEVASRIDKVEFASSKASALGIVINDIVTSTVNHAHADGCSGRPMVEVWRNDRKAVVVIADDGRGNVANPTKTTGFEIRLIVRLPRQVGATTTSSGR